MLVAHDREREETSFALVHHGGGGEGALLGDTLVQLAEQMARALDCSECCIYEFIPSRNLLRAQALWSRLPEQHDIDWVGEMHRLADSPGFRRVICERQVLCSYPDELESGTSGFESMAFWGELATIWAPIVHGDQVLGMVEIIEKVHDRRFSEREVRLARQMASLAAIALFNARASRAAEERNRQLSALIGASRAMTSTLDLDELLHVICRHAALALDSECSYIYGYDPTTNTMVLLAEHQRDPQHAHDELIGSVYDVGDLPQNRAVVRTRLPVEVRLDEPELDDVMRGQLLDWGEMSSLMVPLLVGGRVVGALEVSETVYPRRFSDQEAGLCVALGEQAAAAIHNAQLHRRLREQKEIIELQAVTDGLTGLANHRAFWKRLRDEVARADRYGQSLSLLMLDLDDFKQVNDRYGHLAGDEVLRAVGNALRAQLRQGVDCAARYGGEEFAVILPCTGPGGRDGAFDGTLALAERVRQALTAVPAPVGATDWTGVTVSIGVAAFDVDARDAEGLVGAADRALYRAKRAGKDRVVAA